MLRTSNNEIITALPSTSYCVILANPSPLGFSYLLGPCSTFSELENYSRESSTKLLTLPSLWESSIHSLDFPYHSHLISPKAVSNPDYTLPVSQMPQALHIQSQTHHLTLQTYFSSSRVPLFHERHLIHPVTQTRNLPPFPSLFTAKQSPRP